MDRSFCLHPLKIRRSSLLHKEKGLQELSRSEADADTFRCNIQCKSIPVILPRRLSNHLIEQQQNYVTRDRVLSGSDPAVLRLAKLFPQLVEMIIRVYY